MAHRLHESVMGLLYVVSLVVLAYLTAVFLGFMVHTLKALL